MNQIKNVADFMAIGGQEINKYSPEQVVLYARLIEEELSELDEAHANTDVVGEFDAYLDVLYVTIGWAISRWGVQAVLEGWEEVQNSNMSKYLPCSTCGGAESVLHSTKARHLHTVHECPDCVQGLKALRREDGKVLKGSGYFKPDLKSILEKHNLLGE